MSLLGSPQNSHWCGLHNTSYTPSGDAVAIGHGTGSSRVRDCATAAAAAALVIATAGITYVATSRSIRPATERVAVTSRPKLAPQLPAVAPSVTPVAEWDGQEVYVMMEDDAHLTEDGWKFFLPRQEQWYLIK